MAVAHATTLLNSGIYAPGLLNSGLYAPGLLNSAVVASRYGLGAPLLSAPIATSSVVATPGAITTDKRVIGTTGLIAGAPLVYGNSLAYSGLYGAAPLALGNGIVSPIGLKGAGLLAAPGLVRTILK